MILEACDFKSCEVHVKINNNEKKFANILKKELDKYNNINIYITSFSKKFLNIFAKNNNYLVGPIILNNNIRNKRYNFFVLNI